MTLPHHQTIRGRWPALLSLALAAWLATAAPALAADPGAPVGRPASEIVLNPDDLGPDFVVASSGQTTEFGLSAYTQNLVRDDRNMPYVEPDGIIAVRSVAVVVPDRWTAEGGFEQLSAAALAEFEEVPVAPFTERARAGILRGEGPYDPAAKIVLFQTGTTVGYVVVGRYDESTAVDDTVPLARIMAARAAS